MPPQSTENTGKILKNLDFVAWQIKRAQRDMHKRSVNRVFNARSRLIGCEKKHLEH